MKNADLVLSRQQVIWLKDLICSDIQDWQNMAARPVDEVGVKFAHLSKTRINTMQDILTKFEAVEAIQALQKIREKGLIPEIVCNANDILAVVLGD